MYRRVISSFPDPGRRGWVRGWGSVDVYKFVVDVDEGDGEGKEGMMNPPGCWMLEVIFPTQIV